MKPNTLHTIVLEPKADIYCFPVAKEPDPAIDSVLAKWEETSQKVKTLDAKLTVFRYDGVFGDGTQTITQGRFYYERRNLGRYEIHKRNTATGVTNDWSNLAEVIIWTGKEKLSQSTAVDSAVGSSPRRNYGQ